MTKDEQARARLVEFAQGCASTWTERSPDSAEAYRQASRIRAGMKRHTAGSWCAAGLTAAMEDAGLVVPAPGTPARRGAVALLDFVGQAQGTERGTLPQWVALPFDVRRGIATHAGLHASVSNARPGDVIAWLQNKAPEEWLVVDNEMHAFHRIDRSMCGKLSGQHARPGKAARCSSCVWETRKGHVALVVAVESWRIGTVGWNEGPSPGRVQMRWLVRDPAKQPPSKTVLYRRPGGIYGIARPVAR